MTYENCVILSFRFKSTEMVRYVLFTEIDHLLSLFEGIFPERSLIHLTFGDVRLVYKAYYEYINTGKFPFPLWNIRACAGEQQLT